MLNPYEAICAAVIASMALYRPKQDSELEELRDRLELLESRTQPYAPPPDGYWRDRYNRLLSISSMEDGHLFACLKGYARGQKRDEMLAEAQRRGISLEDGYF